MDRLLGIDIGGTSIKVGVFALDGFLEATTAIPTKALVDDAAFQALADSLRAFLAECACTPSDVVALGLDVPGPVDESGKVGALPNIELDPSGLKSALHQAFPNASFAFVNDANAAALGELWQGAAKGEGSFALIAIGTGVGAGLVVGGKLVSGAFGAGGEIGHITVNRAETEACGCGRRGCLEQYASATGIVRSYRDECEKRGLEPVRLVGPSDSLAVFEAYRAGDEAAHAAVLLMCDCLGFALAQVSAVADPGLFLIGGGVGKGFELFEDELRAAYLKCCFAPSAPAQIIPARLGNEAALYGSAYLALQARGSLQQNETE